MIFVLVVGVVAVVGIPFVGMLNTNHDKAVRIKKLMEKLLSEEKESLEENANGKDK